MEKNYVLKFLGVLVILMACSLLYMAVNEHYKGFHNVDMAYNYMKLTGEIDEKLLPYGVRFLEVDKVLDNSSSGIITLQQGYRTGVNQMLWSSVYSFLFGMLLCIGVILVLIPEDMIRYH